MKKIKEAISKEERQEIIKFSRTLKKYLLANDLKGLKIFLTVSNSVKANPYIRVGVKDWKNDIIPNALRLKAYKAIKGSNVSDINDIHYGNISPKEISLNYYTWKEIFKKEIKESYHMKKSEIREMIREEIKIIKEDYDLRNLQCPLGVPEPWFENHKKSIIDGLRMWKDAGAKFIGPKQDVNFVFGSLWMNVDYKGYKFPLSIRILASGKETKKSIQKVNKWIPEFEKGIKLAKKPLYKSKFIDKKMSEPQNKGKKYYVVLEKLETTFPNSWDISNTQYRRWISFQVRVRDAVLNKYKTFGLRPLWDDDYRKATQET